jgi:hypothetical protein
MIRIPRGGYARAETGHEEEVDMADLDTAERRKLADQGKALPDGSFPIRNREDLKDAIQSHGRAKRQGRGQTVDQATRTRVERREGPAGGLVGAFSRHRRDGGAA